ncbi:unnamed protein product, partial [Schistosoma turkestanicum]
ISKIQSNKLKSDASISSASFLSTTQLNLYLSACKLLATSLLYPECKMPQFTYYQWAFVKDITFDNLTNQDETTNCTVLMNNNNKTTSFLPFLSDVLTSIDKLQEIDMILNSGGGGGCGSSIDTLSMETISTSLHQSCYNLLALDKLVNIFTLKPFIESLNHNASLGSTRKSFNADDDDDDVQLLDGFLLELAIEASLAQEFPETIASR